MSDAGTAAPRRAGDLSALRRHVAAIADLGLKALAGGELDELFDDACALVVEALAVELASLVEDVGDELVLRSYVGWPQSASFSPRIPRSAPSQTGYTLDVDDVVVLTDVATESRFVLSESARNAGIGSGISVPIRGPVSPFGVLAAHTRGVRAFTGDEIVFLRLLANVVAAAVESHRAAEASLGREQLIATLVEHGPDIVTRFDRDLRRLYVSPAITRSTGLPPEWYIGKTNEELGTPAELSELLERELRPVLETGVPRRYEFEFDGPDGRRWFESHAVAEPGPDGRPASIVVFTRDRTEARRAEVERLTSETRYRELFELATDMIFLLDERGRFLDVNAAAQRALGYSRHELIGMHYDVVLAPAEIAAADGRLARKLDGSEQTSVYESAVLTKDGALVPIQASSRAITRDGRSGAVLVIARDVSEQKAAQAALEQSEQLFRSAFDDAAVGMLLTNPAGDIIRVNAAFARMLGYSPDELAGRTIDDTTHPDDVERMRDPIAVIEAGDRETYVTEKRYLRRDGEVVWGHVGMSAVRSEDGTVLYLVAQVEDVTELRRVQQELKESQAMHGAVVQDSRDLITVHDLDGTIRLISRSVEEILGYTQEELIGRKLEELIHEEDLPAAAAAFALAVEGGQAEMSQARLIGKDGSLRVLDGKVSPGFDADGRPTFLVANSRDVTERMWLEEQLRQSQKMEAIGKLAGGVAHDFNNLLTAINGYSDIALSALPPEQDDIRHSLEEIRRAGERAAELTRQLLAFSRRQVLRPEPVDLNGVVEGYLALLERLLGEDVTVRPRLDPTLRTVNADPGQLGQVLLNLVVNARDAMPDGGELRISTASATVHDTPGLAPGPYAVLTVGDTGVGMDAETRRRVFEPFFTTKEPGKGTGMGLSTVHGIVEQSGGMVTVESRPGLGTTFRVYLPAVERPVAPRGEEAQIFVPRDGATILLVEDEPLVRGIVEQMLESLGYRVLAASGPRQALALAEAGDPFDLVLTDVVMPEMNGHELASRLVELRPGMRIVYTSGYTGDVVEARGVLGAHDAFLQKPFTATALGAKLRAAFARLD